MKVSICIPCKGRLHHLRETLPENLEVNRIHPETEFVVIDYDSQDGLFEWMAQEMHAEITSGRLIYLRLLDAKFYRSPHAKNIANNVATGEVIANVDADHFTGEGFSFRLSELFSELPRAIVSYDTGGTLDGILAIRAQYFHQLRGYDERMSDGWGYYDTDFRERAIAAGLRSRLIKCPRERSIAHSSEERTRFMLRQDLTQVQHLQLNMALGHSRVGPVNPGGYGVANVFRNFDTVPFRVGRS